MNKHMIKLRYEIRGGSSSTGLEKILSPRDAAIRDYTAELRLSMLDELFSEGSPKKTGEMRIANELLNGLDAVPMENIKIKASIEMNESNNEELMAQIETIFQNKNINPSIEYNDDQVPEIGIPTDLVPEEGVLERTQVTEGDIDKVIAKQREG